MKEKEDQEGGKDEDEAEEEEEDGEEGEAQKPQGQKARPGIGPPQSCSSKHSAWQISLEKIVDLIRDVYVRCNPAKLSEVKDLLAKYKARGAAARSIAKL